jgi:hypothetical protein
MLGSTGDTGTTASVVSQHSAGIGGDGTFQDQMCHGDIQDRQPAMPEQDAFVR